MYTLKIESKTGALLELTHDESNYQVVSITGLNPPKANIYTSAVASMDGAKFKGSKLDMRNIVVTVRLNGDAEANRLFLYRHLRSGKWCKIHYSNGSRKVFIEGYCETLECDPFTDNEIAQISIVCPQPYFKNAEAMVIDISKAVASFEFPFTFGADGAMYDPEPATDDAIEFSTIQKDNVVNIRNYGEIETGVVITIENLGNSAITNPMIYNDATGDYIKVNLSLSKGHKLVINTNKGEKSVKLDGESVMYALDAGTTWFVLDVGDNLFSYSADANPENLGVVFEFNALYEGV